MRRFPLALAVCALFAPGAWAADLRFFDDAPLHAVQFLDTREGWAVGDDGVVLHTVDGGDTWERQPTGIRGSLRSLHFITPLIGWVAGRDELAGGGSVGILLYTRDGGETWHRLLANTMPGLNYVRFGDPKTGYVLGDGCDQYPSGVCKTVDGGRTWQPVKGPRATSWLAGDFKSGNSGVLVGAWSKLATLRDDTFASAQVDALGGRDVRGLALGENKAFAVGQGGLVLTSVRAGTTWGYADLKLPVDALAGLDFHAVASLGDQAWVVGRPGSVLLHSANRGTSWTLKKTGQPLPLNGIFFFDQKRGWAVGELGLVMATSDGGQTWRVQRQGGQRAGVLFLHGQGRDCPLETVAVLGAEEGHLTAAIRVAAADTRTDSPARSTEGLRFSAALRRAGGAAGEVLWQFPMPRHLESSDRAELLKFWTQMHGDGAEKQLLRQLVLALRIWRPSVVICDPPEPRAGVVSALTAEALQEAVKQAGDREAFPEQIETLGLQPWRVSKVYANWDKRTESQVVVDGQEDRRRLEAGARDFVAEPLALLADGDRKTPYLRCFRLLASSIAGADKHQDFFTGVPATGGTARRTMPPLPDETEVQRKAQRTRRTFQTLSETPLQGLSDPARLLGQIAPTLADLGDDYAARAILALANQYARQGQWAMARETFLLMAERYPLHPRAVEAYRWLIQHSTSSEARRRHELGQFLLVSGSAVLDPREPRPEDKFKKPGLQTSPSGVLVPTSGDTQSKPLPGGPEVVKQASLTVFRDPASRHWHDAGLAFGERLGKLGQLFASDPSMQFCLQAARRQVGQAKEAQEWYREFTNNQIDGPWKEVAATETWLAGGRSGQPLRPVAVSREVAAKPFLDGEFDDACWANLKPLLLRDAMEQTAKDFVTEAWFTHDDEFLYVALRCKHPKGLQVAPIKGRPRDSDLRPFDRVSILLDLDRDYSTCFHLQVDQRGCVAEDCWGDKSWNPQWFVAVKSKEDCWQIEAAIPLKQLTADRVTPGTAWAINVVRVLPGRGVQGWSLPAGIEPRPEGLGLLLFERPANPPPTARQKLN